MKAYEKLHQELEWLENQMKRLQTYNRRLELCLGSGLVLTALLLLGRLLIRKRDHTLRLKAVQDQTVQAVLNRTA